MKKLAEDLATGSATIAVVGMGYVGVPLAAHLLNAFDRVVGFDIDEEKLESLRQNNSYLPHLPDEMFSRLAEADNFVASSDPSVLQTCSAVVITVPTPLGAHNEPDLGAVIAAGGTIGANLADEQLIVLESTTYPGTTREVLVDAIRGAAGDKFALGERHFLAYSPERENPGGATPSDQVPKLVGGLDSAAAELAQSLYERAFDSVVMVASAEIAEAAKLLENIFRAVNIAMINEMKVVLTALDIDVWQVVEAASSKPFGFTPFYPGPGLGGHCIPIDPFYLAWRAREAGQVSQFIELAGQVNRAMPEFVLSRLVRALSDRSVAMSTAKVLVVGLAYKGGVSDTRESPGVELADRLCEWGAAVSYHDPFVGEAATGTSVPIRSVAITAESVKVFDAVLIATAHDGVDYETIATHANVVVDTRNAMAPYKEILGPRLVTA